MAVTGAQIVREARRFLGRPYVYGAAGPTTFDCSGLVQYTLKQLGITAPRTSEQQWTWVQRIPASQAGPGDLIFEVGAEGDPPPGHVGIVESPGRFINAPYTGAVVRVDTYSLSATGELKVMGFGRVPNTTASSVASLAYPSAIPGKPSSTGTGSSLMQAIPGVIIGLVVVLLVILAFGLLLVFGFMGAMR